MPLFFGFVGLCVCVCDRTYISLTRLFVCMCVCVRVCVYVGVSSKLEYLF